MSEDDSSAGKDGVSRRKLLRGVATTGIVGLTGSVPVSAVERADETVTEVTGESKRSVVGEALSDSDVRTIKRTFVRNGWRPDVRNAKVMYTADEENGAFYHTVVLPFETKAESEQAMILWTDSERFQTQGRHYDRRSERAWDLQTYAIEAGAVATTTERLDFDSVEENGATTQVSCSDVNWACVLSLAGAYVSTIASCGACVLDPTKLTCLACIGAILSSSGATLSCDWCDD